MKKVFLLAFLPVSFFCNAQETTLLSSGKSADTNILYSDDFESPTINSSVWMKEAIDTAKGITTSRNVARKNGRSARFSFNFSDWTDVDSLQPGGHRTELHPRHGTVPGRFDLDKDYWIGFSNYFPTSWKLDPTTTIIWQFHGYSNTDSLAGGSNQPPLYGSVNANKNFVNIQVIDSTGTMFSIGTVTIVKGQWNDWVMHIKFSYKSGFDTVWVNGKRVAAYRGSNFYHVAKQKTNFGPYFKIGIYKPSWGAPGIVGQASNLTMYDDALVVGSSKSSYSEITSFFGSTSKFSNTQIAESSLAAETSNSLDSCFSTSKIIVYPNPVINCATIQINSEKPGNYTIELMNISGEVLQTKRINAGSGLNKIKLDFSNYTPGMYLITLTDNKHIKRTVKFNILIK